MDWDHAPCALHTKLLKVGRGHDLFVANEAIRVQYCTTDDRDEDNREAASEDLGGVPDEGTARHSAEISDHLCDGDGIGGEVVLVLQHGRVDILRTVGHEVEASHEKDQVHEEEPVLA